MKVKTVPVKNVSRLAEAADMLVHRSSGMPGIGLVDGETGHGKTYSVNWLINRHQGIFVRAQSVWTPASMLKAILIELDRKPRGSCSDMLNDLVLALRESERSLFIDEADNIINKTVMVEMIRDIHDLSIQPVILVGYTGLDISLSAHRQLTRRVLAHVRFEPTDLEDAALIARELCEVKVADDLLARLHTLSRGSVGELVIGLNHIESFGRTRGKDTVTSADWGKKDEFFTKGIATSVAHKPTQPGAAR